MDFVKETKPDYYRAQMWYCEPGAPIQDYREKYQISGEGFVWSHSTMDSLEATDHIDRMFLSVNDSIWLPQWSFDFWTIPYLIGRNITLEQFKNFMAAAQGLLRLEIASVKDHQKESLQRPHISTIISEAKNW